MRLVGLATVLCLLAPQGHADEAFGIPDLQEIAGPLFQGACETRCETANWEVLRRSADSLRPEVRLWLKDGEALYEVSGTSRYSCGAGRCTRAFVMTTDAGRLVAVWSEAASRRNEDLALRDLPTEQVLRRLPSLSRPTAAPGAPTAMIGLYGYDRRTIAQDCAIGPIAIRATEIRFHESTCTLFTPVPPDAERHTSVAECRGEGSVWLDQFVLRALSFDHVAIRSTVSESETDYFRCPD